MLFTAQEGISLFNTKQCSELPLSYWWSSSTDELHQWAKFKPAAWTHVLWTLHVNKNISRHEITCFVMVQKLYIWRFSRCEALRKRHLPNVSWIFPVKTGGIKIIFFNMLGINTQLLSCFLPLQQSPLVDVVLGNVDLLRSKYWTAKTFDNLKCL